MVIRDGGVDGDMKCWYGMVVWDVGMGRWCGKMEWSDSMG